MSLFSFKPAALCAAAVVVASASPLARAQAVEQHETVHYATLENDMPFDTDRYYSSGIQLSIKRVRDQRAEGVKTFTRHACAWLACEDSSLLTSETHFGQLMFTPADITVREAQPADRPWAGLLYVEQSYALLSPDQRTLTTLTAQVGVTGPPSMAEESQKLIHKIRDLPLPQGWHNQIGGSLAVMASAEQRTALDTLSADLGSDVQLNTAGYWRLTLGNTMTYAAGGLALVVGKDLPLVSPPPPGIGTKLNNGAIGPTTCMLKWVQCTAFGIVETRLVGRNVFLDGRLFRDDPKVRRRNFVTDLMVGMRLDFPNTRTAHHGPWFLQFKVTRRSREYSATFPVPRHRVAAITLGTEF